MSYAPLAVTAPPAVPQNGPIKNAESRPRIDDCTRRAHPRDGHEEHEKRWVPGRCLNLGRVVDGYARQDSNRREAMSREFRREKAN